MKTFRFAVPVPVVPNLEHNSRFSLGIGPAGASDVNKSGCAVACAQGVQYSCSRGVCALLCKKTQRTSKRGDRPGTNRSWGIIAWQLISWWRTRREGRTARARTTGASKIFLVEVPRLTFDRPSSIRLKATPADTPCLTSRTTLSWTSRMSCSDPRGVPSTAERT